MTEVRKSIGESVYGANDGISVATDTVRLWLENEPGLLTRARQIIAQDKRDSSALFPAWVAFLLFGDPRGGFNLDSEPPHDARMVLDIKADMDHDDFRRIDWDFIRADLTAE